MRGGKAEPWLDDRFLLVLDGKPCLGHHQLFIDGAEPDNNKLHEWVEKEDHLLIVSFVAINENVQGKREDHSFYGVLYRYEEREKREKRNACPLLKWSNTKEIDVAKKDWFRTLLNSLGYMNECLYVDDVIGEMMIVRLWPIIMNIRFTIYDLVFMYKVYVEITSSIIDCVIILFNILFLCFMLFVEWMWMLTDMIYRM